MGVMDLDEHGVWIDKPFDGFARSSSEEMLLPPPVPQEWLDYLEEIDPPPPLRDDAGIDIEDVPGIMPSIIARAMPSKEKDAVNETGKNKEKRGDEVIPASAVIREEKSWAEMIPSFLK